MRDFNGKGFATRQIHSGKVEVPGSNPLATPIFQTSTFIFDNAAQGAARFAQEESGYIYTRLGHPNATQVAEKLALLEHAEAGLAMGSGMGCITAMFWTLLKAGDHVLADETLYGCTFAYLSEGITRFGVEVTFADFSDVENVTKNIRPNTKIVYFETPVNPHLKVIDIEAVAKAAHAANPEIKVAVDNTFCTPYLQLPMDLGADLVIHSATKYLNGHADVIAGVILGSAEFIQECTLVGLKNMTGAAISPFDAYLIARGMKTLDIRMERHCKNAMEVAKFLESHPKIRKVYYPGLPSDPGHEIAKKQMKRFGGMVTFELEADRKATENFVNSLDLCTLAVSLGGAETLVEHPATMTHSTYSAEALAEVKITESMVRMSVGLEDWQDIVADLENCLKNV